MRNCLNCECACRSEDFGTAFCLAYCTYIYIPLDSMECPEYTPRNEEES